MTGGPEPGDDRAHEREILRSVDRPTKRAEAFVASKGHRREALGSTTDRFCHVFTFLWRSRLGRDLSQSQRIDDLDVQPIWDYARIHIGCVAASRRFAVERNHIVDESRVAQRTVAGEANDGPLPVADGADQAGEDIVEWPPVHPRTVRLRHRHDRIVGRLRTRRDADAGQAAGGGKASQEQTEERLATHVRKRLARESSGRHAHLHHRQRSHSCRL